MIAFAAFVGDFLHMVYTNMLPHILQKLFFTQKYFTPDQSTTKYFHCPLLGTGAQNNVDYYVIFSVDIFLL